MSIAPGVHATVDLPTPWRGLERMLRIRRACRCGRWPGRVVGLDVECGLNCGSEPDFGATFTTTDTA
jgi:hypothetical protein